MIVGHRSHAKPAIADPHIDPISAISKIIEQLRVACQSFDLWIDFKKQHRLARTPVASNGSDTEPNGPDVR